MDASPAVLRRDPAAVPVLVDLLKDENWHVRFEALLALGQTPALAGSIVQPVTALLRDKARDVRDKAIWNLVKLGTEAKNALTDLTERLCDRNDDIRIRCLAAHALGEIGNQVTTAIAAKNVLPGLMERLRDPSEDIRVPCSAAHALGELGRRVKPAAVVLRDSLKAEDLEVRVEAAMALWRMTNEAQTVLPVLVAAVKDTHSQAFCDGASRSWTIKQCRSQAAYLLGEIGSQAPAVIPILMEALDDPDVRWAACSALGCIGPKAKDSVQALARVVREEKHDGTLRAAIGALAHIGPDAASGVPSLTALLERRDQTLRADHEAVAAALRRIDSVAAKEHGIP
jgi:HEAT repeat protein